MCSIDEQREIKVEQREIPATADVWHRFAHSNECHVHVFMN